jgi:FkbM family methyltransferase
MGLKHRKLRSLVQRDDPLILEIGSNDGTDAVRFLDALPGARVICFEPDPRAIARWKTKVTHPRAELHEIAIGAADGTLTFHQSGGDKNPSMAEGWDYSGSLRPPKKHLTKHPDVTFDQTIDVPVRSLDSWAAEAGIEAIDFIWADVQGGEKDLILGGGRTLANTRYIYTEYYDVEMYAGQWTFAEIAAALPGHKLIKKWDGDALFALKSEPGNWLSNKLKFY